MFRKTTKPPRREIIYLKWRGTEILRIEAFSDAIFAFAMTLLVVSLEVPKSFTELQHGLFGMAGFGICYLFLFMIWREQYLFFRHYFIKDTRTLYLNALLLFVVLFYIYPLKFLFELITEGNTYYVNGKEFNKIETNDQLQQLMLLYTLGFSLVYFVFLLMYLNALRMKDAIQLTAIEIFNTRTQIFKYIILISIALFVALVVIIVDPEYQGLTGMLFTFIWPALSILFSLRKRTMKKLFRADELAEHERIINE